MAKVSTGRRGPTAVDSHVGQKIRARRMFLRMSQTEVADAVGITFQQIQKYERGANRRRGVTPATNQRCAGRLAILFF